MSWHSGFTNICFNVFNSVVIDTFPKSSPSMVEENSARDAHKNFLLFYCFISLKKSKSVSIYKQLNAKRDLKQINYFSDINWQKMAERGADVSARDIMFAQRKSCR